MTLHAKHIALGSLVVVLSVLCSLIAIELGLRLFYPVYQSQAETDFRIHAERGWSRPFNHVRFVRHPDTGEHHAVYGNNMSLNHPRDFTPGQLQNSTVIAFFGDSFTDNIRLPTQYGFTEVLDYLLNRAGHGPFTVMNYGTDGYGTAQLYLQYRTQAIRHPVDTLFYVFTLNDIRNNYETNLFALDDNKQLVRSYYKHAPWFVRKLSRLHLTYLVMDAANRLWHSNSADKGDNINAMLEHAAEKEQNNWQRKIDRHYGRQIQEHVKAGEFDKAEPYIELFKTILQNWQADAKERNTRFVVAVVPWIKDNPTLKLVKKLPHIDIYGEYEKRVQNMDFAHMLFVNDDHWNERGNMYAAMIFFDHIAKQKRWPVTDRKTLQNWLAEYYAAFENGWFPDDVLTRPENGYLNSATAIAIREKYGKHKDEPKPHPTRDLILKNLEEQSGKAD